MLSTFVISFREFLEVFLIIGVFLGISKKLKINREKEILAAAGLGILISLLLPISVFIFGEKAGVILNEKSADLLSGYLMIFSGFFIAYVVFSLHNFFVLKRSKAILLAHQKMQTNVFDLSLFFTIVFFTIREGFEIALFTGTTALFSRFMENFIGLMMGFVGSSIIGTLAFFAYIKFSIGKIFRATEYLIVLLGASLVVSGVTELSGIYFNINISKIMPIPLGFLPSSETVPGHIIKTLTGLEPAFSVVKLAIIFTYILSVYLFLIKKPKRTT